MPTTITAQNLDVTITFTLYGDVDDARLHTESLLCQHRAAQLVRPQPKVERPKRPSQYSLDPAA